MKLILKAREGLVKKVITDKLGRKNTVWVKPDKKGSTESSGKTSASGSKTSVSINRAYWDIEEMDTKTFFFLSEGVSHDPDSALINHFEHWDHGSGSKKKAVTSKVFNAIKRLTINKEIKFVRVEGKEASATSEYPHVVSKRGFLDDDGNYHYNNVLSKRKLNLRNSDYD